MIYRTIYDCPAKLYHRILATGDLKLLVYETIGESIARAIKNEQPVIPDQKELEEIFENIQWERIDKFGVSDEYQMLFYKKNTLLKWELRKLQGDVNAETEIQFAKKAVESTEQLINKSIGKSDPVKQHARLYAAIEHRYGKKIDDSVTIAEYETYVADLTDESRKRILTRN